MSNKPYIGSVCKVYSIICLVIVSINFMLFTLSPIKVFTDIIGQKLCDILSPVCISRSIFLILILLQVWIKTFVLIYQKFLFFWSYSSFAHLQFLCFYILFNLIWFQVDININFIQKLLYFRIRLATFRTVAFVYRYLGWITIVLWSLCIIHIHFV